MGLILYHIQECECLRPRGAEAVWEAADGKPDRPRRGWLTAARRPKQRGLCAVFGRVAFRDERIARERDVLGPCSATYTLCGGIPLGVSGLRRQRAARRLAGKTGRGALTACRRWCIREGLCQPHGGYPSRGCGAGAGRCGSVCCRGAGGHRRSMGAISRTTTVWSARAAHLAPRAIVKAGNTVPAQMKIESGTVLERGAAFLPIWGDGIMSKLLILGAGGLGQMVGGSGARRRELGRRGVSGRRRPPRGRCRANAWTTLRSTGEYPAGRGGVRRQPPAPGLDATSLLDAGYSVP